jgi:Tfp pilus assembly protein PilX
MPRFAPPQPRRPKTRRPHTRRTAPRRGLALLLVMGAVAVVAILSYSMLASATLSNRAGANQAKATSAEFLAESGVNLAMYYLQYPERAPGYPSNPSTISSGSWYWPGTNGAIALNNSLSGTVSVTVTPATSGGSAIPWTYEVVSTGNSGGSNPITRTTGARVYVRNEYQVKHAAVFNASVGLPSYMNVQGDVWAAGTFGLKLGTPAPGVTGTVYCTGKSSGVLWLSFSNPVYPTPFNNLPAPSAGTNGLNTYATYKYNDVTYSRKTLSSGSINAGDIPATPAADNPAGIYYFNGGTLALNDDVVINGTLIVEGSVQMKGVNVVINPQPGFPGLVVTNTLEIFQAASLQPAKNLTVNGVCYIGTLLKSNGATPLPASSVSWFKVNGALLSGQTSPSASLFATGYNVTTTVKPVAVQVPDLTSNYRVPVGISVVRWGLP